MRAMSCVHHAEGLGRPNVAEGCGVGVHLYPPPRFPRHRRRLTLPAREEGRDTHPLPEGRTGHSTKADTVDRHCHEMVASLI